MPIVQIEFRNPLNTSVQVGDTAYFINPIPVGVSQNRNPLPNTTTPHQTGGQEDIIKIGEIKTTGPSVNTFQCAPTGVNVACMKCDMPQDLYNAHFNTGCLSANCLAANSFIMFSKDNKANTSSMLGYYASAQFTNDSTEEAELFDVGVDIFESSK